MNNKSYMAKIYCVECLDVIGVCAGDKDKGMMVNCRGQGNHPMPKRYRQKKWFGLYFVMRDRYEESRSEFMWREYRGQSIFVIQIMLLFWNGVYSSYFGEWFTRKNWKEVKEWLPITQEYNDRKSIWSRVWKKIRAQ